MFILTVLGDAAHHDGEDLVVGTRDGRSYCVCNQEAERGECGTQLAFSSLSSNPNL